MKTELGTRKKKIFISLLRKAKRKHYEDLSIADVTDNNFWKRVKPLFGNKIKENPNIALIENNYLITNEKSLAQTFNDYFVTVSNLGVNILDHSVDWGTNPSSKIPPPLSCQAPPPPPLKSANCPRPPLFRQSSPLHRFFVNTTKLIFC